ncbi:Serpin-ZX [Acorus calamus]|uniref:Serpin-ZX n=1 Tax=Acorus calamus TaxID=4465 RepID=A0AAV9ESY2_ACOCL|nr:Serpin-ZX [Acorus calamus]
MDLRKSIENQTDWSLSIAHHVGSARSPPDSNLVLSPVSVHSVLAMVAAGSTGSTLDQSLKFLRSDGGEGELRSLSSQLVQIVLADGSASGGPKLAFAGSVWVDRSLSLKAEFEKVVREIFGAEARAVDFQSKPAEATKEVNSWAETATNGLIKDVLPPGSVNSNARLILANGLYFKGSWKDKFDPSVTSKSDFHRLDGSSIKHPFMTSRKKRFLRSHDGFKVLRMPYAQGRDQRQFSMYLFLPDARDGLRTLSERLASESGFLDRHCPTREIEVGEFRVPKFKFSYAFEASATLKELGLTLPFSAEAELTGMVESEAVGKGLTVSGVFHKAFVEVNEEGTEAAAASAAVVMLRALAAAPDDFVADHPFVFVIREDVTGVVVFYGHVVDPSVVSS